MTRRDFFRAVAAVAASPLVSKIAAVIPEQVKAPIRPSLDGFLVHPRWIHRTYESRMRRVVAYAEKFEHAAWLSTCR